MDMNDALPSIKISPDGIDTFENMLNALHGFYCKVLTTTGEEYEGLLDGLDSHAAVNDDGTYIVLALVDDNGERLEGNFYEIALDDTSSIYFF